MKQPMTVEAARRIQSATAQLHNGVVPKGSFAARAMSVAMKSNSHISTPSKASKASKASVPNGPSKTGNPSGGGRGNNPPRK